MSESSILEEAAPAGIGLEEYEYIRKVVYEHSRINLGAEKKALVSARVAKRLRALKLPDFDIYCRYLQSSKGRQEAPLLIEAISTNHTYFFRETRHFEFLRDVAALEWSAQGVGALRIWSAAASSGEEPYTIAITLAETLGFEVDWRVLATDISVRMLDVGRCAVYSAEKLSPMPMELQKKYFQRGVGASDGFFRIKQEVRRRVEFTHINLLQPTYPFETEFDIVFCRNVMIYFDRETQQALVEKISPFVARGGYLMIGHSECLREFETPFRAIEPSIYQKR